MEKIFKLFYLVFFSFLIINLVDSSSIKLTTRSIDISKDESMTTSFPSDDYYYYEAYDENTNSIEISGGNNSKTIDEFVSNNDEPKEVEVLIENDDQSNSDENDDESFFNYNNQNQSQIDLYYNQTEIISTKPVAINENKIVVLIRKYPFKIIMYLFLCIGILIFIVLMVIIFFIIKMKTNQNAKFSKRANTDYASVNQNDT